MAVALALVLAVPLEPLAHESPVDHVDRSIRIWISGETIHLSYQLQLSERAAMMQLTKMDSDADGVISERERDAYFSSFADALSKQLHLQIENRNLELKRDGKVQLQPQFRQVFTFTASCGTLAKGKHPGRLNDEYSRSYPGVYRWDGPKVDVGTGPRVIVTDAPKAADAAGHAGTLQLKFEIAVP